MGCCCCVQPLLLHLIGRSPQVLLVGAGPGWEAVQAVEAGAKHVIHTDFSPVMVALAAEYAQQHAHPSASIQCEVMDCCALSQADASVDCVCGLNSVFTVPDKSKALAEMNRVLRGGGVAVISAYTGADENAWLDPLEAAMKSVAGKALNTKDMFKHEWTTKAAIETFVRISIRARAGGGISKPSLMPSTFLCRDLRAAGFEKINIVKVAQPWVLPYDYQTDLVQYARDMTRISPIIQQAIADLGGDKDKLEAFAHAYADHLKRTYHPGPVAMEMTVNIAFAYKKK